MPETAIVTMSMTDEYRRTQFKRLKKAIKEGFYMEAIYIESTIMDDNTELALRIGGVWDDYFKKRRGHEPALDSKIRYIQIAAMQKKTLLNRFFGDDLLEQVLSWKNERNRLLQGMQKQNITEEYIERIAEEGKHLSEILNSKCSRMKRAAKKKTADR